MCEDMLQHCPQDMLFVLLVYVFRMQDDCNKFLIIHKIACLL